MTTYFLLFLLPVIGLASKSQLSAQAERFAWFFCMILWTAIIGLRHEIGCDWEPYLDIYLQYKNASVFSIDWLSIGQRGALAPWEPAHLILNLISGYLDLGMYGVNTLYALLFVAGISSFCRNLPSPWLALTTATPYLLTVVAMGYSRQAAAIGLIFWSISFLMKKRVLFALALALVSVLFHQTAAFIVVIIVGIGPNYPDKYKKLVLVALASVFIVISMLHADKYDWSLAQFHQADTLAVRFRTILSAIPAAIFLSMWKKFKQFDTGTSDLWRILSILSITAFISVLIFPTLAPTAIDRFSIFLIPIQLFVWSYIPRMLSDNIPATLTKSAIVAGYGLMYLTWLNFSNHKHCWVPYDNVLFYF